MCEGKGRCGMEEEEEEEEEGDDSSTEEYRLYRLGE